MTQHTSFTRLNNTQIGNHYPLTNRISHSPPTTHTKCKRIFRLNPSQFLNEKVKELSDSDEVQNTFYKQNDQMACRALKEGVHFLLRQRLIISPETTFEKLRQFALEEEPYVKPLRKDFIG